MAMIEQFKAARPEVHAMARTLAIRCVDVISACLREEERIEACREFYTIIREELEKGTDARHPDRALNGGG